MAQKGNKKETISLIAALSLQTRAIGKNGELLWQIPEDIQRFKALTLGHPVIMGRKTWGSLPEKFRPLPGRTNIVVSRSCGTAIPGMQCCNSIEDALTAARASEGSEEIFIIGGGELYKAFLPYSSRLYLTLVDSSEDGDAYFPEYPDFQKTISTEQHVCENLNYSFVVLERN